MQMFNNANKNDYKNTCTCSIIKHDKHIVTSANFRSKPYHVLQMYVIKIIINYQLAQNLAILIKIYMTTKDELNIKSVDMSRV